MKSVNYWHIFCFVLWELYWDDNSNAQARHRMMYIGKSAAMTISTIMEVANGLQDLQADSSNHLS